MTDTYDKEKAVQMDVAKLIISHDITINQFYKALGIDLDDVHHSDPDRVVTYLAGVFAGMEETTDNN